MMVSCEIFNQLPIALGESLICVQIVLLSQVFSVLNELVHSSVFMVNKLV